MPSLLRLPHEIHLQEQQLPYLDGELQILKVNQLANIASLGLSAFSNSILVPRVLLICLLFHPYVKATLKEIHPRVIPNSDCAARWNLAIYKERSCICTEVRRADGVLTKPCFVSHKLLRVVTTNDAVSKAIPFNFKIKGIKALKQEVCDKLRFFQKKKGDGGDPVEYNKKLVAVFSGYGVSWCAGSDNILATLPTIT